jgi:hypothetical protein
MARGRISTGRIALTELNSPRCPVSVAMILLFYQRPVASSRVNRLTPASPPPSYVLASRSLTGVASALPLPSVVKVMDFRISARLRYADDDLTSRLEA